MIQTNGRGYEEMRERTEDSHPAVMHHRLLAYGWGYLDSPFAAEDCREVHHRDRVRWHNVESNLLALPEADHREAHR
jgi:hypothetical protein